MDKPEAKDHVTKNVLDYISAADYINEVLGYDQRDVAGKFANGHCSDAEYQDYWHYVMDALFDNFCNDSFVRYGPYSFSSFAEQTERNLVLIIGELKLLESGRVSIQASMKYT
jgi:hypothetical protein